MEAAPGQRQSRSLPIVEREGFPRAVSPISRGGPTDGRIVSGKVATRRQGSLAVIIGQDLDGAVDAQGLILGIPEPADRGEPVRLPREKRRLCRAQSVEAPAPLRRLQAQTLLGRGGDGPFVLCQEGADRVLVASGRELHVRIAWVMG